MILNLNILRQAQKDNGKFDIIYDMFSQQIMIRHGCFVDIKQNRRGYFVITTQENSREAGIIEFKD